MIYFFHYLNLLFSIYYISIYLSSHIILLYFTSIMNFIQDQIYNDLNDPISRNHNNNSNNNNSCVEERNSLACPKKCDILVNFSLDRNATWLDGHMNDISRVKWQDDKPLGNAKCHCCDSFSYSPPRKQSRVVKPRNSRRFVLDWSFNRNGVYSLKL